MRFESWPPAASAPFRTGRLRSGAVSSSWTWNLLSLVFITSLRLLLTVGKYTEGQQARIIERDVRSRKARPPLAYRWDRSDESLLPSDESSSGAPHMCVSQL